MDQEEFRRRLTKPLDQIKAETSHNTAPQPKFMTIEKYVSNPTGKGSAYVGSRKLIKDSLNILFIKLLRQYRRYFYAIPYLYSNGDLLFHVKVPSENFKINKITYDVLFFFKYDQQFDRKHRAIKVYSNSPSFIFTYAFVYNKEDLLIDNLKSKLPPQCLTQFPEIRNPIGSLGFERSTFIAAKYLIDGRCLTDDYINRFSKVMTPGEEMTLHSKIADPDLLLQIYQHAQYKARETHRKQIPANEMARRDAVSQNYVQKENKLRPKTKLLTRSPRAKITARKARKAFLNTTKK